VSPIIVAANERTVNTTYS